MQASQQLNKSKIFCKASGRQRFLAGIALAVAAGFLGVFALAAHYRIGLWPYGCGFKQRYDLPCLGCGMTTSAVAFAGGRIFEAFYIQPAAAVLCCVLAVSAFLALLIAVFGVYPRFLEHFFTKVKVKYLILALIIIVAAGWAVTLARAV